jgi:hypothetical protein
LPTTAPARYELAGHPPEVSVDGEIQDEVDGEIRQEQEVGNLRGRSERAKRGNIAESSDGDEDEQVRRGDEHGKQEDDGDQRGCNTVGGVNLLLMGSVQRLCTSINEEYLYRKKIAVRRLNVLERKTMTFIE